MRDQLHKATKGFTLAELLIVVAIILVLVAVAIPVFVGAQAKAQEAVDAANVRSVKAEAAATYSLTNNKDSVEGKPYIVADDGSVVRDKKDIPAGAKQVASYQVAVDGKTGAITVQKNKG